MEEVHRQFRNAAYELKRKGHEAVNPLDILVEECEDAEACKVEAGGHTWACWMRADIRELVGCQAVYALGGWQSSRGASIEVGLADSLGIPVYYEDLKTDLPVPTHTDDDLPF